MNGRRKLTSLVVNIAYADAARMLNARAFLQVAEKGRQRDRNEVHGAKDNERHVSRRRLDGEQAVSGAEASGYCFPPRYGEGLDNARTKPAALFSHLLRRNFLLQLLFVSLARELEGVTSDALDLDRARAVSSYNDF